MELQKNNRLEYVDALRGFAIILVILVHMALFSFGVNIEKTDNVNYYFVLFHVPLFFFISGFVFYKSNFNWELSSVKTFLLKKVPALVLSPFLFFLCYIYCKGYAFGGAITASSKMGYWFTFALFGYFVLYVVLRKLLAAVKVKENASLVILFLIGFALYATASDADSKQLPVWFQATAGVLGISQLRFFVFFVAGICVKKYFNKIELLLDGSYLVPIAVISFFAINIFVDLGELCRFQRDVVRMFLAFCGIVISFSLFRKYKSVFAGNSLVGSVLVFVGKRTLDIYLLHYFFICFNLKDLFPFFSENNMPLLELVMSFVLAVITIAASLAVGVVFRIDKRLAHYLFGAPLKDKY